MLRHNKYFWAIPLGFSCLAAAAAAEPVVVLMDTTAPAGVYDSDNRTSGGNNTKELSKILTANSFLSPSSLRVEPLTAEWDRESVVTSLRPDLVIIHRSAFHHSYNAVFKFGATNEFSKPADDPRWRFAYQHVGDERLINLLGILGSEGPRTRFLVYSRGTDTNWLNAVFRSDWVKKVGARYPKLKDRIDTLVIPNGYSGTFRDPTTADLLRQEVRRILKLPGRSP